MSDFLIWQYRGKNKARRTAELLLSESSEVCKSAIEVGRLLNIDESTGYGLDLIGRHVGLSRILTTYVDKDYFGFAEDNTAISFDEGEWYQFGDALKKSVVLDDEDYRFLIKAKILKNYQTGEIDNLIESVRFLFGDKANVFDNYDMSLTGIIPFQALSQFKIYAIKNLDILRRPVCVKYKFFQSSGYSFGFYEDDSAYGFDKGNWSDFI